MIEAGCLHQTYIAGVKFREGAEAELSGAPPDCEFRLEPEPGNAYDPNAVKVLLDGAHVGYVPKKLSAEVNALIAAGRLRQVRRRLGSKSGHGIEIHYIESEAHDG